jgi:hypothetical protein
MNINTSSRYAEQRALNNAIIHSDSGYQEQQSSSPPSFSGTSMVTRFSFRSSRSLISACAGITYTRYVRIVVLRL